MEAQPGIRCPSCGHGNRPERRFCTACGSRLGRACTACGAPSEAEERFCGSCGAPLTGSAQRPERSLASLTPKHLAEKILASRVALEGERKQVTVLFADVKGSMDLAEQVDPEVFHQVMERFAALLAEGVHRFEGTVTQFTGDGVMALFGAPIAHEDHAQRACYAALHLQEALRHYGDELRLQRGLNFAVRIGLNSGEVVVGTIGDDLRMDYTAQGHTVGLAQRMEQLAAADRVYLTQHTARLVQGFFRLRDLGPLTVKGVTEPVRVYELEGVGTLRTRLDVARARGFSRFVGRDAEMQALEAALARAWEGNGQVVGVVAEPGVGKSRLCLEFLDRCRSHGLQVLEGRGVAHGKNIPLLPMLEISRAWYGITAQDSDRTAREKMAGRLLLLDDTFRDLLPLLFDFHGVPDPARPAPPMDPEARQRQLFAVLRRLVQSNPGVTLIEDLHWLDGSSETFLAQWVEFIADTPNLFLVNFRPEYHAAWMQKSYYQQLPLAPLGPAAIAELLQDLLGTDPSLAGLGARIQERTGGNPFFIEEVVQALEEAGNLAGRKGAYRLVRPVATTALPATVQAVLAARIDRLGEREKAVLQTAAVIGKDFTEPVLRAVADLPEADLAAALRALTGAEFVYETALYPQAEYAFKHPLTQEVAYRAQLGARRARLHAAVARTITDLYADKLDERAALLAHHWEAAGEALEAARWHQRAAEWVLRTDVTEARRHWERVRALVAQAPASEETAELAVSACVQLFNVGWRCGMVEEEAAALFAEGEARIEGSRNPGGRAMLLAGYAVFRGFVLGDTLGYVEFSREAVRHAELAGDPGRLRDIRVGLMTALWNLGALHDALAVGEQMLSASPRPGDKHLWGFNSYNYAQAVHGFILALMGRLAEGQREIESGLSLMRQQGEVEITGYCFGFAAWLAFFRGDTDESAGYAREELGVAARTGVPVLQILAHRTQGIVHLLRGEWDHALDEFTVSLGGIRDRRTALHLEGCVLADTADAHLGRGDLPRARAAAAEAITVARARRTDVYQCQAQITWARVLLGMDGADGRGEIEAALAAAEALGLAPNGRTPQMWA